MASFSCEKCPAYNNICTDSTQDWHCREFNKKLAVVMDALKPSTNNARAEICPYHKCDIKFAGSCVVSRVDFCRCGGKLSPVA